MDTVHCNQILKNGKKCSRKALKDDKCKQHLEDQEYSFNGKCITITFGDNAENGVGMEKIGEKDDDLGRLITPEHLQKLADKYQGEIIDLRLRTKYIPDDLSRDDFPEASVLILRDWCRNPDELFQELMEETWDQKALFRGEVKNKNARHNLCFSDRSSEANYSKGKGTVLDFEDLPELYKNRKRVAKLLPFKTTIFGEGNLYYDVTSTYIGLHGDTERSFVLGLRLGDPIPLYFKWFYQTEGLGKAKIIELNHGDLYIMSFFATGNNWKKRNIPTLRHAAGYPGLIKKL